MGVKSEFSVKLGSRPSLTKWANHTVDMLNNSIYIILLQNITECLVYLIWDKICSKLFLWRNCAAQYKHGKSCKLSIACGHFSENCGHFLIVNTYHSMSPTFHYKNCFMLKNRGQYSEWQPVNSIMGVLLSKLTCRKMNRTKHFPYGHSWHLYLLRKYNTFLTSCSHEKKRNWSEILKMANLPIS